MFSLRNSPDPMLGTILNQGKKWNNWMSNYKNLGVSKVKLDLIGKTTGPNLGSIVEPLVNPKRKSHLSRLEADFDSLNQEYEKTKSIYFPTTPISTSPDLGSFNTCKTFFQDSKLGFLTEVSNLERITSDKPSSSRERGTS